MRILEIIFGHPATRKLTSAEKNEFRKLLEELIKIGKTDDFLSLQPGGPFNARCHHTGARKIGERLNEIGGIELMQAARAYVARKLKPILAEHLDHCWSNIGDGQP